MSESTLSPVVVVGAGTMGHGIAHVAAAAGHRTTLCDVAAEALERALSRVERNLEGGVQRGKLTAEQATAARARLRTTTDLAAAVADAHVVIEAVVEDLDVKRALFATLESSAPDDCVLATNTSSLSIARIAEAVRDPGRVIGMHFFNPVHVMKLLEIVVHDRCSDATRQTALDLARAMGKEPIVVQDSPGFASSRLGIVLGLEAMRMLEQGVASAADIDRAMCLGYGHPMGPLRLTDLVGLDVRLAIAEYLHGELGGDQYRAPELLRRKVADGELGKKSGRGFYDWSE